MESLGMWGFRVAALAAALACFLLPDISPDHASIGWVICAAGLIPTGFLIGSFDRLSNIGTTIFVLGILAAAITAGIFPILEPDAAAEFSNLHDNRVRDTGTVTPQGARTGGIVWLVIVALAALWVAWASFAKPVTRDDAERTRLDKIKLLLLTGSGKTSAEQAADHNRRQRIQGAKQRARNKAAKEKAARKRGEG